MKKFVKLLSWILWTVIAMLAGNYFGADLPVKILAIVACAIIVFLLGVAVGRAGKNAEVEVIEGP